MVKPQEPEGKLHMGAIPYDADPVSTGQPKEMLQSLWMVTVNVIMRSRMRESRTYGSVRTSHREVWFYSIAPWKGARSRGWKTLMERFSKPPLASLGSCLVTASVKRRQLGCRVAMLISPESLQSLKGWRSLSMRKATSLYALCEYTVTLTGFRANHVSQWLCSQQGRAWCLLREQVWCTTMKWRNPNAN